MNKIGLLAFGITTSVLVPTTLHVLQAGPNQVAKLVAPDMTSIQVGDAKVDIVSDKGLVDAGGKVHVTVTATSDKREKVALAVLVYEASGMAEGRTEAPPVTVGRDEVTLDTKDGKASKTFAFTLPGNRAYGMDGQASFGHYTILVMDPKVADELERRHRHADNSGNDPQHFFSAYDGLTKGTNDVSTDPSDAEDHSSLGKAGQIARLDVSTASPSDHMKIIAGDVANADSLIAVKVRVKNPTKRDFESVDVSLTTHPEGLGGSWAGIAPESVEIEDGTQTIALKAHETKDVVFHVKTSEQGTLGLYASMGCSGDTCSGGGGDDDGGKIYQQVQALNDSVLDGIDIMPAIEKPAEETPPAVQAQAEPATAPAMAPATVTTMPKSVSKDPWAVALEPIHSQTAQTTTKNPEIK